MEKEGVFTLDFSKFTMPRFKTEEARKEYEKALTEFNMVYFASDEERRKYLEEHGDEMGRTTRMSIEGGLKWGEELPKNVQMRKDGSVYDVFAENGKEILS